jgi:hypothetical protein
MFPPVEQASGPAASSGMTIYIDPETGAILSEPAPGSLPLPLTPQEQNALSTSAVGLTQEPSAVPGGGIKLDLQGRFQNPMMMVLDANGNARSLHIELPATGDQN